MKRYFSLFLCALLCIGITGCKESGSTKVQTYEKSGVAESTIETPENSKNISDEFSDTKETDKNMTDIVDRDGRHIGQIPFNTGITLTNSGIFYTTVISGAASPDTVTVGMNEGAKDKVIYHLYDTKTCESYTFGSITDQDYEAGYCRTELDGKLYTLITTGNALDKDPDPLLLVEFDLQAHTINQYTISENGFPYTYSITIKQTCLMISCIYSTPKASRQNRLCSLS